MATTDVTGFSIATLLGVTEGLASGSSREALPGTGGFGPDGKRLPGGSGPTGIESVLEYNGAFLNVRDWIDTFLVTTIGGLDDADVRDSREVNPGYHGETAFKGYYGGRTITLTGKVFAHTLFKLRDMQQGLRQAFAQLDRELPLVFRTRDPNLDMLINCKKSQAIQMAEEQRTANHFERQFMITLRASNPRFLSVVKVHSAFAFANIYDFSQTRTIIKETFDDPGVMSLYNAKGDAFKIESGMLRSNGKPNLTNCIVNPSFDAPVDTANIVTKDCRLEQSLTGGVDGGPYCIIHADKPRVEMEWRDFPVRSETFYSASEWVRAEAGCKISFDVEWRSGPSAYWESRAVSPTIDATGAWQEIKLENMWSMGTVTDVTTEARWRLIITNGRVGASYGVDRAIFVNGATLPVDGYFDGTNPLAYWDGGVAYEGTSTMFPYTILTTNRTFANPMMTVKLNIAAIDSSHRWSMQDVYPEGLRIVLAYIDEGNQIYVSFQDKPSSNTGRFVFVIWRNGEMETYASPGLANQTVTNFDPGDSWWRAYLKNGEAVIEWWKADPYSGVTDGFMEDDYIKLTQEQSALFEQDWPMQLIVFDQEYEDTDELWQDTLRLDEFTYQSVGDLHEWDYIDTTSGVLNPTVPTYRKSGLVVQGNTLHKLSDGYTFILRNDLPSLVGDGTITIKLRYDEPFGGSGALIAGIIGKYVDKNNFIYAGISMTGVSTTDLWVATTNGMSGGFQGNLTIPRTEFPEDTDRWLRLVMNGNTFTVEFWKTDPALGGAPAQTKSGTLTGTAIAKLGTGVKGRVGLRVDMMTPSSYIDNFTVAQSGLSDIVLDVFNEGNFRAQPVFELSGPLTNLQLTNEANDEWISIPTTIPNGETWVIDIEDHRMYRQSDQANRFQYLDANSDWMELEPGENPISALVSGTAVASQISVDFHHTVM